MNAYLTSVDRRAAALGQLGDLVCVEGDCKAGEAAVKQMQELYNALTGAGGGAFYQAGQQAGGGGTASAVAVMIATKYGPTVAALVKAKDDLETWARRWVPFHPNCCAIRDIGKQAQDITQRMAADAKVAAPTPVPLAWTDSGGIIGNAVSAIWSLGKLAILVGGGLYVWKQIQDSPNRKTART